LRLKTQIYPEHTADYLRTRLDHTLEVAQIARHLARQLRLNEDLADAISLAHDIGHTPFCIA
jgi:dGTPase